MSKALTDTLEAIKEDLETIQEATPDNLEVQVAVAHAQGRLESILSVVKEVAGDHEEKQQKVVDLLKSAFSSQASANEQSYRRSSWFDPA